MSLGYSVASTLAQSYDLDTIKTVLLKGKKLGFNYYYLKLGIQNTEDIKKESALSVDEATKAILNAYPDPYLHAILVEYHETVFYLLFLAETDRTLVMINNFINPVLRQYSKVKDTAVDFYIRLLLDLVEDFLILSLHVEKD